MEDMRPSLAGPAAATCLVLAAALAPATAGPAPDAATPESAVSSAARVRLPAPTTRYHYIANAKRVRAVKRVGFNVIDTGSSDDQINALPRGTQAMVWLGQKCPAGIDDTFRAVIDRLASNPKVFGYFLSDEPHIADCPKGPAHLARKTRYIRHASGGRQKSFIVLSATVPSSYHAFRPAASGVSMVGIDPYPCSISNPGCDFSKIRLRVRRAVQAGIRRARIAPTFQAFGQEKLPNHYYNLPTPRQLKIMLNRWSNLVKHPMMDFTYGWGHQASANPTLRDSTGLKDVLRRYFAK
jgi:hypothetical protein